MRIACVSSQANKNARLYSGLKAKGMTKSQERGENEITVEAQREAARTKQHVCGILAIMLAAAKAAGDTERVRKIIKAQKYLGCRNIRKRRGKK